ncbi:MAG: hypothetical protein VYB13_04295 [Chloroflexota bacterium]|nr:hypothetical protein [Chloroflexota bacterium]MEC9365630.1 hypothetical protein [Chloroflexota bacterium]MED6296461.1 hypothetical protein [Chloroflexota bacterium]
MSAEIIVYGAQIITGLATLVVAFVLVFQLKQQRSVAQRELVLAINQQRQDLAIAVANNPDLSDINFRGGHDFADLHNQSERIRFNRMFAAEMSLSNIAQEYADLLHVDPDLALKTSFALFPGRRKFYKESLIRFTLPTPFVEKVDTYIKEIETNVGEDGQDLSVLDSQIENS